MRRSERVANRLRTTSEREFLVQTAIYSIMPRTKKTRKVMAVDLEPTRPEQEPDLVLTQEEPVLTQEQVPPQEEHVSDQEHVLEATGDNSAAAVQDERPVGTSQALVVSSKKRRRKAPKENLKEDSGVDKGFHIPESLQKEACFSLLQRLTIKSKTEAPLIPLHRMISHDVLRKVKDDQVDVLVASMKEAGGFLTNLSGFILSIGPEISDDIREKWNDLQQHQDSVFELELHQNPHPSDSSTLSEWSFLSNKMLLIWDGNHRFRALEKLQGENPENPAWYERIKSRIIDVSNVSEVTLLQALRATNDATAAIIPTTLIDTLQVVRTFCQPSEDTERLIQTLSPEDQNNIAHWKKGPGKECWYQYPRLTCAKLIYPEEFDADLAKIQHADDFEAARKLVYSKYEKKLSKLLDIVDPALGEEWFDMISKLVIDHRTAQVTLEKLYAISGATVSSAEQIKYLKLLLKMRDRNTQKTYGLENIQDKEWIKFLHIDVYWKHVKKEAMAIFDDLVESNEINVQEPFEAWYDYHRAYHKMKMYTEFLGTIGRFGFQIPPQHLWELHESARRMVVRYLHEFNIVLPNNVKTWSDPSQDPQMWSRMFTYISRFEKTRCPFWLDYPVGEFPTFEADDWEAHKDDRKEELFKNVVNDEVDDILEKKRKRAARKKEAAKPPSKKARARTPPNELISDDEAESGGAQGGAQETHDEVVPVTARVTRSALAVVPMPIREQTSTFRDYGADLSLFTPSTTAHLGKHIVLQMDSVDLGLRVVQGDADTILIDKFLASLLAVPTTTICSSRLLDLVILDPPLVSEETTLNDWVGFSSLLIHNNGYLVAFTLPGSNSRTVFQAALDNDLIPLQEFFVCRRGGWLTGRNGRKEHLLAVQVFGGSNVDRTEDILRLKSSNLYDDPDPEHRNFLEFQPKSFKLMSFIVERLAPRGGIVFDHCCGVGSSVLASVKSGRHIIAMDINPNLVEYVKSRLKNPQPPAVPIATTQDQRVGSWKRKRQQMSTSVLHVGESSQPNDTTSISS